MAGLLALSLLAVGATYVARGSTPADCPGECQRAVASAVYYALMQLDCDEADYGISGNCNDELENVNKAPTPTRVTHTGVNWVVDLDVALKGGAQSMERETVSPNGEVIRARTLPH